MSRENIPAPVCMNCECYLCYQEHMPKKQNGVTMHLGERFCLGSKRARRFRRSDPKLHVPSWCPKRKSPCVLRVYGFKNRDEAAMHSCLCFALGKAVSPEARRYAVEYELTTSLTPKDFWEECCYSINDAELVGAEVSQYGIVEIDDGIMPVCFYKVDGEYQVLRFFDTGKARANELEREDTD